MATAGRCGGPTSRQYDERHEIEAHPFGGEGAAAMSDKEDAPGALLEMVSEVQRIIAELPAGLKGAVDLRGRHVYMEIQVRDSPAFEVVLGSEAPEIVYDEQFIQYKLIGGEIS